MVLKIVIQLFSITIASALRASTSVDAKFCIIEKTPHFTHFDLKNTHISKCKIVHLYTSATVTVHICTVIVTCVFNILHFFSLLHLTLSASHSHLSLVLSLPQSTNQLSLTLSLPINSLITDHQYPTYGDHRKSLEFSRTTKLKVRKKRRRLVEINKQTTKEESC